MQKLDEELGIHDILVQEYLTGTEYSIGMIGNVDDGFHFFPIRKQSINSLVEIDFSKILEMKLAPILGYESKWEPTSPYWSSVQYRRASLELAVQEKLKQDCIKLFKRFGLRDYARFDWRSDAKGEIKLLECNPNPGWYCALTLGVGMVNSPTWEKLRAFRIRM